MWKKLPKISKLILKLTLGLMAIVIFLLLTLHLPPVQNTITRKLTHYLTNVSGGEVGIERMRFSLLGNIEISGLHVRDPLNNMVLDAGRIFVDSDILELLRGNFVLHELQIDEFEGQLIQSSQGLNIKYFIDAFKPETTISNNNTESHFQMRFENINIRNLKFEYSSISDSLHFTSQLARFRAINSLLSTNPNEIRSDSISIDRGVYSLNVSSGSRNVSKNIQSSQPASFPSLDLISGFYFDVSHLGLNNNQLSYKKGEESNSNKFDPDHISIDDINISLQDIISSKDSLKVTVHKIGLDIPEFSPIQLNTVLNANHSNASLHEFNISTHKSQVNLDLNAFFKNWPGSFQDFKNSYFDLIISGHVNMDDIAYFMGDSIMQYFSNWPVVDLESSVKLDSGDIILGPLKILSGNNSILAIGNISNLFDGADIAWKDLQIESSFGTEFKSTFSSISGNIRIPDRIRFSLKSSGNLSKFMVGGDINTSWGILMPKGTAGFQNKDFSLDLQLKGNGIRLDSIMELNWIGNTDFSLMVEGIVNSSPDVNLVGMITTLDLIGKSFHNIDLKSRFTRDDLISLITVEDPDYNSTIKSEIHFSDTLDISNEIEFDHFSIGNLVNYDSTLKISGVLHSKIRSNQMSLSGNLGGRDILIENSNLIYPLDTFYIQMDNSEFNSMISLTSPHINIDYEANFDFEQVSEVMSTIADQYLIKSSDSNPQKNRSFKFNLILDNSTLFKQLGLEIDHLTGLIISGNYNENSRESQFKAYSGRFNGYGISLDTLYLEAESYGDSIKTNIFADHLYYDSIQFGKLKLGIFGRNDTAFSKLTIARDTRPVINLDSYIKRRGNGLMIYPDSLEIFDEGFIVDRSNPVMISNENIEFNKFKLKRQESEMMIDGNVDAFDLNIINADLRRYNTLFSDSTLIQKGFFNGQVSYNRVNQFVDLQVVVDSLTFKEYPPLLLQGKASSLMGEIPFEFILSSTTNNLDLTGNYSFETSYVDAILNLNFDDLKMFEILSPNFIDEMGGRVDGKTVIKGPLNEPRIDGTIRLQGVNLVTSNPRTTIGIEDETIKLDNSGLYLDDFTLYDQIRNPLTINGFLKLKDFQHFTYDFLLKTDNYIIINNPDSKNNILRGILVVGSDIKISGNEKDTYVDANVIIRDTTDLTYVTTSEDIELISGEGIVEFVNPQKSSDLIKNTQTQFYSDSLISNLPKFKLSSTLSIEDKAVIRLILDSRSGDFIQASGTANLEVGLDRNGAMQLNGLYTIKQGHYRLSFYDIVKKDFIIVPGSTLVWSGDPYTGEINVTALQTIRTTSTGLIGHEVGENERALYRRALPYEVGIIITGQVDQPDISFSLDLPEEEKANFPALASKLNRLKQPEFESELNKQVFGLLVLGGFIPESGGSDLDQSLIATTAISNSVNSILASQLNRFTNKYVKGVDIDVGLQSFRDYSAGSGQTRTTMEFKITKRMMDDRLSFEIGGGMDITSDQSSINTGSDNFRGDVAIIYDLTESGNKQLKAFNNGTYDIIYHEIRNTGVSLIFIKEFDKKEN